MRLEVGAQTRAAQMIVDRLPELVDARVQDHEVTP